MRGHASDGISLEWVPCVFSVANFSFWQLSRITTIWFTIVSCIVIHANCQKFRYWLEQPHVDSHKHKSSLWIISLWFLTIVRMKNFPHWKHTAGHCESNSCDSWRLPFNRIICYKPVNKQKQIFSFNTLFNFLVVWAFCWEGVRRGLQLIVSFRGCFSCVSWKISH